MLNSNGDRFRRWAEQIAPNTRKVVDAILTSGRMEQQSYRSCMGLLRLADKHTTQRLDKACERAWSYSEKSSYKSIKNLITVMKQKADKVLFSIHLRIQSIIGLNLGDKSLYKLMVECACYSVTGKVRSHNEDNIYFLGKCLPEKHGDMEAIIEEMVFLEDVDFLAVFDGMGGEQAGEKASYTAAGALKKNDNKEVPDRDMLQQLVKKMNLAVCNEKNAGLYTRIGTTLAMLVFYKEAVWTVNVGDSPIFRLRDNVLTQVSDLHVEQEGKRKVLSQCLGIEEEEFIIEPCIKQFDLCEGDMFLACSDGLTDMLSLNEIHEVLSRQDKVGNTVKELINRALANGGKDNITVILARVGRE